MVEDQIDTESDLPAIGRVAEKGSVVGESIMDAVDVGSLFPEVKDELKPTVNVKPPKVGPDIDWSSDRKDVVSFIAECTV